VAWWGLKTPQKRKNCQKMEQLNSYKLEKSPILTSQLSAILKDDWYKMVGFTLVKSHPAQNPLRLFLY
jgi:hypothetical protein